MSLSGLRLVLHPPAGGDREVVVQAEPSRTVADLAEALCAHLELQIAPADLRIFHHRTGLFLTSGATCGSVGLRIGDELSLVTDEAAADRLVAQAAARPAGTVELCVVGGPLAGRRIAVTKGPLTVGRDAGCAVRLEDPSVSALHMRVTLTDAGATIEDAGSTNGVYVDGERLRAARQVEIGQVVELGRTLVAFRVAAPVRASTGADTDGRVPLNRPPRQYRPPTKVDLRLPSPPAAPPRRRIPIAASLVPIVAGIAFLRSGHGLELGIITVLLGPIVAVLSVVEERVSGRRQNRQDAARFRAQVADLAGRASTAAAAEAARLRETAPDVADLVERAESQRQTLWDRRRSDVDFSQVRVGWGDHPSGVTYAIEPGGIESLRQEAESALARFATAASVPMTVNLRDAGITGVCGPEGDVAGLARSIVVQAATLHSPEDLLIAVAASGEPAGDWDWMEWLPHSSPPDEPLGGPQVVAGASGAGDLFRRVIAMMDERLAQNQGADPGSRPTHRRLLLLVEDDCGASRAESARILASGPEAGILTVWLAATAADLPGECTTVISIDAPSGRPTITYAEGGAIYAGSSVDAVDLALARRAALALAPLRDAGAHHTQQAIPESLDLLDLLPASNPDALVERWKSPEAGTVATLGMGTSGPLEIDLLRDGPHALILGATGSGKTEILRALIAGFAASRPPDRLGLVLIDGQGGLGVRDLAGLPHVSGRLISLDRHEGLRTVAFLRAELRRREEALTNGSRSRTLVVAVDDYHAIPDRLPELAGVLDDCAGRGRGLDIHLLVASQRESALAGLATNAGARIVLEMAEAGSASVIGSPESARLQPRSPGRGVARLAADRLVAFQGAFTSGPAPEAASALESIRIRGIHDPPSRRPTSLPPEPDRLNQMQLFVRSATQAQALLNLEMGSVAWPGALPTLVSLDSLGPPGHERAAVGLVDEPAEQRQRPLILDLERDGSLLVIGSAGSGKTTLLRTVAVSLARSTSPAALQIHVFDFGGGPLVGLRNLPHCPGVHTAADPESVAAILHRLRTEVETRLRAFAELGCSSLAEHRRLAAEPLPRLAILLDGYAAFAAIAGAGAGHGLRELEALVALSRPCGLHFVIAAEHRALLPATTLAVISQRVILRQSEAGDYQALGLSPDAVRDVRLAPGRGFTSEGLEVQVAHAGIDPSPAAQAAAVLEASRQVA